MSIINIPFKWVFIGSGYFAREVLLQLYEKNFLPNYVITTPDKPAGRGLKPTPNPVKDFISNTSIPLFETAKVNSDETRAFVVHEAFDFLVVCDFGKILKRSLLESCTFPAINIHPSLLPLYRGPAPIERSLLDGVKETGVTIIEMTGEVDAGPILAQKKVEVSPWDNKGTLMKKLAELVPEMLSEVFKMYLENNIQKIPQGGQPTYAPKIKKEELFIDWKDDAEKIVNKIRAFSPTPGARTKLDGTLLKILNAKKWEAEESLLPGQIKVFNRSLIVGTGNNPIEILELQPEGKRVMFAREFLAGRDLEGKFFG